VAARLETQVCIAGGGPAGMMLGYLLARAGVDVVVLEKHADFLRDFRGDTIHPSTMEIMGVLGLLDAFLELPHQRVATLAAQFGEHRLQVADFSKLPVRAPYIAMMPQWDFLTFLAERARAHRGFHLMMHAEASGLIVEGTEIKGVRAATRDGVLDVHARLTIGADGRSSRLRSLSGLAVTDLGAPMDVLWFSLSRRQDDTDQTQARFDAGRIFIMLNRGDYWQCAFVIPKGANARIREAGLERFRAAIKPLLPVDASRADEIEGWEQVKLLSVEVNRLEKWSKPGLLCIGDAAHAMSPVGGVGVNLAVQDAVAAANILVPPLTNDTLATAHLAAVQARREWPTRVIQRLQLVLQNSLISSALSPGGEPMTVPPALRLLMKVPILNRIPGRLVGLGIRPELPDPELFG
jgi:2-polyprenyl-6-methoxyphenol hydroxylase-like FAD-dependent oxidoreductase